MQHQHLVLSCLGNYLVGTPAGERHKMIKLRISEIKVFPMTPPDVRVSLWPHTEFSSSKDWLIVLQGLSFTKLIRRNVKSDLTHSLHHSSPCVVFMRWQASKYPTKLWDRMESPWEQVENLWGQTPRHQPSWTVHVNRWFGFILDLFFFFYLALNLLFEWMVRIKAASIRNVGVNKIHPWELFSLRSIPPCTQMIQ